MKFSVKISCLECWFLSFVRKRNRTKKCVLVSLVKLNAGGKKKDSLLCNRLLLLHMHIRQKIYVKQMGQCDKIGGNEEKEGKLVEVWSSVITVTTRARTLIWRKELRVQICMHVKRRANSLSSLSKIAGWLRHAQNSEKRAKRWTIVRLEPEESRHGSHEDSCMYNIKK